MVIGVFATKLALGAINTSASKSVQHNFGASSIFSRPLLQGAGMADGGGVETKVSKFVDNTGSHGVSSIGIFAKKCTSVTFLMKVNECNAGALATTDFFDT